VVAVPAIVDGAGGELAIEVVEEVDHLVEHRRVTGTRPHRAERA
jgi:hypothetical protein